ncbi:MAG: hypothetical protein COB30_017750 [Ectothiorhodospiraceae bacterium]|nr:hypothetical protein [Ectothiorhodospiraceae bacterium]
MKNRLLISLIFLPLLFSYSHANADGWSPGSIVSYVRTYDGVNYSIGLKDFRCVNTKDYFFVSDRADNKSFYAIALTSLTAGKKVQILYNSDIDTQHCYVIGISILH